MPIEFPYGKVFSRPKTKKTTKAKPGKKEGTATMRGLSALDLDDIASLVRVGLWHEYRYRQCCIGHTLEMESNNRENKRNHGYISDG
jgi:hypothetical protein